MEEPEELICVGGPCAGRRVLVQPHQKLVMMHMPLRFDYTDSPGAMTAPVKAVIYEVLPFCEAVPGRPDPDWFRVLAYQDRTAPVLRELLAGYQRSFGHRV